jgi:hypothetical protein
MKRSNSPFRLARLPLCLEKMEDRTVPAYTATLAGTTATFTGDAASDTLTFTVAGGLLQHNRFTLGDPGFNSAADFDTTVAGDQTLSADFATAIVNVNAGDGDDIIDVGDEGTVAGDTVNAVFQIDGQGGNDEMDFENEADATGRAISLVGGAPNSKVLVPTLVSLLAVGSGVEEVDVESGAGNDTITVSGPPLTGDDDIESNAGDDTIIFQDGAAIGGDADGGLGTDTIDYSGYTTPVAVNLGANAPGLIATLGADQEVPPTASAATGNATITYNNATHTFDIAVTVDGILATEVTGFHIHRGAFGTNGPIIEDFGTASLVPTATGFTFNATGVVFDAIHEAALLGGLTYLNVHTAANPAGAIRGQIVASGVFVVSTGTGTGVGGQVQNMENATGGSGVLTIGSATFGDGLVGTKGVNVLRGGAGNDAIVGTQGDDTMEGEDGDDILVWSNGDNSDVMNGGAGSDRVQVNGAVGKDDIFTVNPGPGGRLDFDRTNLVPFSLDIGTVENLAVLGLTGNDKFTVAALTGVADLTGVILAGLDGNDIFDVTPASAVGISVQGGPPTVAPGDTLNVNVTGTANGNRIFTATGPGDSKTGTVSFSFRQPISFAGIETLTPDLPPSTVLVGSNAFAAGADAGGGPAVRLFDAAQNELASLNVFDLTFTGGVRVASGDFNADGTPDIVVGTGPGVATLVRVLDGKTKTDLFSINPFEASFTGGVYVAAGDLNGDGVPELVISPDEGGGPRVRVFNGADFKQIADFFGIEDTAFRGGARAAVADVTGDGIGDLLVAAGFGGGPRLAVFDGTSIGSATPTKPFGDFFVFEDTLRNGVFVTSGDLNGDGFAEVIAGGGPGGGPRVFALSGKDLLSGTQTQLANFFAGDTASRGGIRLAVKNLDGDNLADLVVGAGSGAGSRVTGYLGKNIPADGTPPEAFGFDAFAGFTGGVFVG